jgi:predicted transcriptional regulator
MTKPKHTPFLFNVPDDLFEKLRQHAFKLKTYKSEVIIEALEAHLKKQEKK